MNWMSGKTEIYTCRQTRHCGNVCQYSMCAPIEYKGVIRIQNLCPTSFHNFRHFIVHGETKTPVARDYTALTSGLCHDSQ